MPARRLAILVGIAFVLSPVSSLADPIHHWSQRAGSTSSDLANDIAVDAAGNICVVGTFNGTVNFGGAPLVTAGGSDIFVALFNATGVHQWSKRFGSSDGFDNALAVEMDAAGNVYVTGSYRGTLDFGGGPLSSSGSDDIYLVKLNAAGVHQWSRHFGSTLADVGRDLAIDGSGNVMLAGSFRRTVNFGGGIFTSPSDFSDGFVARFDPNGVHLMSKRWGGDREDQCAGIDVDATGNFVITGKFESTVNFGGGPVVSTSTQNAFVASYGAGGAYKWTHASGPGVSANEGAAIALDATGHIYATGSFDGTVDFGGGPMTTAGDLDVYLVKYHPTGAYIWSQRFGSTEQEFGQGVEVLSDGGVIVSGSFRGSVGFGGGLLTSAGNRDMYYCKYNAAGYHAWSRRAGNTGVDQALALAPFPGNGFVIAGQFQGILNLGGGPLTGAGNNDAFFARFDDDLPLPVLFTSFEAIASAHRVEVRWQLWSDESLESYTLYRGDAGAGQPIAIATGPAEAAGAYVDASVEPGHAYRYEMLVRSAGGDEFRSPVATADVPAIATSLEQNFPNPFNPRTTIAFNLADEGDVVLDVYDVTGKRVASLVDGVKNAGRHTIAFDAAKLSSGVYFYRLTTGNIVAERKMVLLK